MRLLIYIFLTLNCFSQDENKRIEHSFQYSVYFNRLNDGFKNSEFNGNELDYTFTYNFNKSIATYIEAGYFFFRTKPNNTFSYEPYNYKNLTYRYTPLKIGAKFNFKKPKNLHLSIDAGVPVFCWFSSNTVTEGHMWPTYSKSYINKTFRDNERFLIANLGIGYNLYKGLGINVYSTIYRQKKYDVHLESSTCFNYWQLRIGVLYKLPF